jgi:hypothetical protein
MRPHHHAAASGVCMCHKRRCNRRCEQEWSSSAVHWAAGGRARHPRSCKCLESLWGPDWKSPGRGGPGSLPFPAASARCQQPSPAGAAGLVQLAWNGWSGKGSCGRSSLDAAGDLKAEDLAADGVQALSSGGPVLLGTSGCCLCGTGTRTFHGVAWTSAKSTAACVPFPYGAE